MSVMHLCNLSILKTPGNCCELAGMLHGQERHRAVLAALDALEKTSVTRVETSTRCHITTARVSLEECSHCTTNPIFTTDA